MGGEVLGAPSNPNTNPLKKMLWRRGHSRRKLMKRAWRSCMDTSMSARCVRFGKPLGARVRVSSKVSSRRFGARSGNSGSASFLAFLSFMKRENVRRAGEDSCSRTFCSKRKSSSLISCRLIDAKCVSRGNSLNIGM